MAANVTGASTQGIYNRLANTDTYHPFDANTYAPWTLEAGDIVTMKRGDVSYESPAFRNTFVWKGGAPQTKVSTGGNIERDSLAKVSRQKYRRGGGAMRNQQGIFYDMYNEDGTLHSSLTYTESNLRIHFDAANSTLHSLILQTATQVYTGVYNEVDGNFSTIEQTESQIRLAVGNATSTIYGSVISMTSTYIMLEVAKSASSISESVIQMTSERVLTQVASVASGIAWSVVDQTMSSIVSEVGHKARVFVQWNDPADTEEVHNSDIWCKTNSLRTWRGLANTNWGTLNIYKWRDQYGGKIFVRKDGKWEEILDSSTIVENSVKVDITDEHYAVLADAVDMQGQSYNSMLEVTAKEIRGEVSTANSQIYSVISRTATNVFSGVYNDVSENFSTIEQTEASISINVGSAKSDLYSAINITSTNIVSTVGNRIDGMWSTVSQTASKVSIVVDNNFNVKPAKIVAAINGNTSTSEVIISADRIDLDGVVHTQDFTSEKIRTMLADITGSLYVSGNIYAGLTGNSYFQGTSLKLVGPSSSQGASTLTLSYSTMSSAIKEASVSNNILKLKRFDGTEVNFSKAVSLESAWANGTFTVNAKQNNNTVSSVFTSLTVGAFSWSGNTGTAQIKATINTSATLYDTGKTVTIRDSNLTPSNIKSGVTIFGTRGTYEGSGGTIADDDIQIGSYVTQSSDPGGTNASNMKSQILAAIDRGVWFGFRAYVRGTTAEKYYKMYFG